MAIDATRAEIEHIRNVVTGQGYLFSGYSINPTSVILTITTALPGMTEDEKMVTENRLKRLLEAFRWSVATAQRINDNLVVTAQRERTLAGIV